MTDLHWYAVRGWLADLIFGRVYADPHDYPVLRERYSLRRSTGYDRGGPSSLKWWRRKYRIGRYVLTVSRTHQRYPHDEAKPRWSFAVQHKNLEHDPYWREEEFPRIKRGWT